MVYLYLTDECFATQEIPIERKSAQNFDRVSLARASATPVDSLISPVFTHVSEKQSLEPGDASLEWLLPFFADAGIKDELSLLALILCSQRDRMTFLKNNFIDKMTLEEMLMFNKVCELQTRGLV
jgi:hypothetical protein